MGLGRVLWNVGALLGRGMAGCIQYIVRSHVVVA